MPPHCKRKATSQPSGPHHRKALDPCVERKAASVKLVKWFRNTVAKKSTRAVCARFVSSDGPESLEHTIENKTEFDALSDNLRRPEVIDTAGAMVLRVIQLCNWGRDNKPLITGTVNAKIYLAAYMIAALPKNVFDEIGNLETEVIHNAKPLADAFHEFAAAAAQGRHWKGCPHAGDLPTLLCRYLRTFKEWKIADEKKLAGRLRRALRGIEKSIAEARKTAAAGGTEGELAAGEIKELEEQRDKLADKLRQIGGAKPGGSANKPQHGRGVMGASVVRTHAQSQAASWPSPGGGMTNEQLAHELMIDGDFRLDDKAAMSNEKLVHTKIREVFERAFWDSLIEDLSASPPSFAPVLNVLGEIRGGIIYLSESQPESHQICEIIDVEHIKAQITSGALTYEGCENLLQGIVGVIINVHARMKAEARKEETLAKWAEVRENMRAAAGMEQADRAAAVCQGLELMLDRIHKVRVDTANNKLRSIAPVIRRHGVEYERSHFAAKLANGTITLARTEHWIRNTVDRLLVQKDAIVDVRGIQGAVPGSAAFADVAGRYEGVVRVGLVNLVVEYPNWGGVVRTGDAEDMIPELVMLDLLRVKALNTHFHTDVMWAVILVQVHHEIRNRMTSADDRDKIMKNVTEILKLDPPRPKNPKLAVDSVMAEIKLHVKEADAITIQTLIVKHLEKKHPVYAHMAKQFALAWYHRLAGVEYKLKVPEAAKSLEADTLKHADFLCIVSSLNIRVHAPRYNDMLNKMLGVGEAAARDRADAERGEVVDTVMSLDAAVVAGEGEKFDAVAGGN